MPRTRLYRNGKLEAEDFPVKEISDHLGSDAVIWLDLCAPSKEELDAAAAEFGLHELAVEDALEHNERSKLDLYDGHAFLSMYAVRLDETTGALNVSQMAAFITANALITVRKDEDFDINAVVARWDATEELAPHGVAFLLYGFLDVLVDSHFEVVQQLDEALEVIAQLLFDEKPNGTVVQRKTFELRRSLVLLRRSVLPMREVVNALMRPTSNVVDKEMLPYMQDVYDHVLRATEWTESLRDLVTTMLETHLTIQGNRMNLIMKKVTSWAAIIAIPTAVTGYYGQNVPYPGFGTTSGYLVSCAVIIVASVGLFLAFRSWDWL